MKSFLSTRRRLLGVCLTILCLPCLSAYATLHTFEVDGIGINGTAASAVFTVDDPQTAPGYIGDSTVFTSITLTLNNIPAGAGSFTLSKPDVGASTYVVTNSGTLLVAPTADYPPTGGATYRLNAFDGDGIHSPLRSYLNYADATTNTVSQVDLITWSPAVAIEAVPEPGTCFGAALVSLVVACSAFRRRLKRAGYPGKAAPGSFPHHQGRRQLHSLPETLLVAWCGL